MIPDVASLGSDGLRLALLVLGHVLADFVFQTDGLASRKREPRFLVLHAAIVLVVATVVYFPFVTPVGALVLVGVAVVHGAIDAAKVRLQDAWDRPAALLVLDQALHGAVLVGAWRVLIEPGSVGPAVDALVRPLAPYYAELTTGALMVAAFAVNAAGGTAFVRAVLHHYPTVLPHHDDIEPDTEYAMGRTIGLLERFIALALVLVGQWGALGLVVAAKSIARFRDLQDRHFAEYYLIGTLASLTVPVAVGLAFNVLVL